MSLLRKIDPRNPALETIRAVDTVPSLNQARDIHVALLNTERPPEVEAPASGRGARPLVITPKAEKIARENQSLTANQQEVIRKAKLPLSGEVPFQPPKNWKGGPLPQERGYGDPIFFDRDGMRWQQGRSITPGERNEWDVQPPKTKTKTSEFLEWIQDAVSAATGKTIVDHANISLTGKVTH